MPANPQSEQELLSRAYAMAGFTLAQLAATAGISVPRDLRRDKGLDRAVDRVAAGGQCR
jgi:DNA mismatch repair protein MutH